MSKKIRVYFNLQILKQSNCVTKGLPFIIIYNTYKTL